VFLLLFWSSVSSALDSPYLALIPPISSSFNMFPMKPPVSYRIATFFFETPLPPDFPSVVFAWETIVLP